MVAEIDNRHRHILVVDDDPDNMRLITAVLGHEGYQVDEAESGSKALEKIHMKTPHLVLLDVNMPGLNGLDTLKQLRTKEHYVSVMFVSARGDTEDVVRGLDAGADDYLRKPFEPTELLARVRAKLRIKDLNDQLRVANAKLQELVDIDDLTGLYNMRSVYERLDHELERGRRYNRCVGVVMMDMDHFKSVNDDHDHLFGSFVLGETGKIIKDNIRQVDFAARYGGDEFLIVLTETSLQGIQRFAERIRKVIEKHTFVNGSDSIKLTASLGFSITAAGSQSVDARTLVRTADKALYNAKEAGRNCVRFYDFSDEDTALFSDPALMRKRKIQGIP